MGAGYGSLTEIINLRDEKGIDWLRKLLRVRVIQEENK